MGLFPGWPIDHAFFAMGAFHSAARTYALRSFPERAKERLLVADIGMGLCALVYALHYLVPGFIRGARVILGYAKQQPSTTPLFSWKCYYCLCASESATMVACALMLHDGGWLSPFAAVCLAIAGNVAGYAKYYIQMWYDHEYVATSIFLYLLSFLSLAVCQRDAMYYILMVYPFMVLLRVPQYADMKGRKILFDEASIVLHSCDHIIHGAITGSVMVYHFYGLLPVLLVHVFVVPLGYFISDGTTRIQQRLSTAK